MFFNFFNKKKTNPFEVPAIPFKENFEKNELNSVKSLILRRVSKIYKEFPADTINKISSFVYDLYFNKKGNGSELENFLKKFQVPPQWDIVEIFCDLRNYCFYLKEDNIRKKSGLDIIFKWIVPGKGCYYKHHNISKEKGGLNGFIFDPKNPPFDFLAGKPVIPGQLLKCDCEIYPILDFENKKADKISLIKKEVVDFSQEIFMD